MKISKKFWIYILIFLFLFNTQNFAIAGQNTTTAIYGEASYYIHNSHNEDGGTIEGTTVTLKNKAGELISTSKTDANGNYEFPNIKPDTYTVTASYKDYSQDSKTITIQENERKKVKLQIYKVTDILLKTYWDYLKEIKVFINDEIRWFNQPPVLIRGTTLVPMRAIFEDLGAKITWNGETKTVTSIKGNTTIVIKIDNEEASVNNTTVKLAEKAQLINGNTMVPLRFVSESLGAKVDWDGINNNVLITMESESLKNDLNIINDLNKGSAFTTVLNTENKSIIVQQDKKYKLVYKREGSKKIIYSSWLSNIDQPTILLVKKIVDKFIGQDTKDMVETINKVLNEGKPTKITKDYNGQEVQVELQKTGPEEKGGVTVLKIIF